MKKRTFLGVLFFKVLVFCKPTHDNIITYCDKQDWRPVSLNSNTLGT